MSNTMQRICLCLTLASTLPLAACGNKVGDTNQNDAGNANQNDAATSVCGDQTVDGTEQCDDADLNGQTCFSLGLGQGTLRCESTCTYDTSDCSSGCPGGCCDGIIQPGEQCDGSDFGTATCQTEGFDGGTLACTLACSLDTGGCFRCGDGTKNGAEECDGSDFGTSICTNVAGHASGSLTCSGTCTIIDTGCYTCGDGTLDGPEACDGSNLDGQICESLGQNFACGYLACNPTCDGWDVSACVVPNPVHQLSTHIGSTGHDHGSAVAVDGAGNVFIGGAFEGTINLGGSDLDATGLGKIYLAKLDSSGQHVWSQAFAGGANAPLVAVDATGNVILGGNFSTTINFGGADLTCAGLVDIFVAKFDPNGVHLWSRRFGDDRFEALSGLAVYPAGQVVLVGAYDNDLNLGGLDLPYAMPDNAFAAKLDASGQHLWSEGYGGAGAQGVGGVTLDATGDILFTGGYEGFLDFGGGPLPDNGNYEAFLVKLDSTGQHRWSQAFTGPGADGGSAVTTDATGNIWLTGAFMESITLGGLTHVAVGMSEVFVANYGPNGSYRWSQAFTDDPLESDFDGGSALITDSAGGVYVLGAFGGTINFGGSDLIANGIADVFIASFDDAGNHRWSQHFGGAENDGVRAVAWSRDGVIWLIGDFKGTADFGGGPVISNGLTDAFLVALDPDPCR